ncbi:MAG: T9SS type A sorting domain-containing protein, partial [Chitinophagales bacterium]|nr:T9SS type A sorting domain-containing protein [Chitinophagales bacterium]
NPSKGLLNVEITGLQVKELYLADITGKALEKFQVQQGMKLALQLYEYPAGIYFLRYQHDNNWRAGKFVLLKN